MCTFSMAIFYLMHHKISLNMGFGFARVQIEGIRISECLLYLGLF